MKMDGIYWRKRQTTKNQNERTRNGLQSRFSEKSGKKKKDKLSGLSEHFKSKKHQLDWSSIKILAKEINYWKRR